MSRGIRRIDANDDDTFKKLMKLDGAVVVKNVLTPELRKAYLAGFMEFMQSHGETLEWNSQDDFDRFWSKWSTPALAKNYILSKCGIEFAPILFEARIFVQKFWKILHGNSGLICSLDGVCFIPGGLFSNEDFKAPVPNGWPHCHLMPKIENETGKIYRGILCIKGKGVLRIGSRTHREEYRAAWKFRSTRNDPLFYWADPRAKSKTPHPAKMQEVSFGGGDLTVFNDLCIHDTNAKESEIYNDGGRLCFYIRFLPVESLLKFDNALRIITADETEIKIKKMIAYRCHRYLESLKGTLSGSRKELVDVVEKSKIPQIQVDQSSFIPEDILEVLATNCSEYHPTEVSIGGRWLI